LGIARDSTLVVFIARLTHQKQPLALIEGFAKAFSANNRLHLLMVGEGDQKDQALARIRAMGLDNCITWQPFRQDIPDILAAADMYILPSLWEGLPVGLLEAMAMGKPVIATRVDGTSEIIEHDQNGWLLSTENLVSGIATAILELGADQPKRERFKQAAIQTINERYNAKSMTRQIEQVYTQVLNSKKKS